MVTTFIVNPGSTSRKYALYTDGVLSVQVFCESTGDGFVMSVIQNGTHVTKKTISAGDFTNSVSFVLQYLLSEKILLSTEDITAIGMRVVAPGTFFTQHRNINQEYITSLQNIEDIAPLHIPILIDEIIALQKLFPKVQLVGLSDSQFHTSIPDHIRTIGIAKSDAKKFDIYRFGYHGLSFASIARSLEPMFGELPKRTIVCHVGGGVSIAALRDGVSIATSMGYSPVSGVLMGSRGGDVTAGVVASMSVQKRLTGTALYKYLYQECGFKGVAGVSDLRLLLERKAGGDADALLAVNMFIHQIHSWIGAHAVLLGGIDTIVLTATAAERNPQVRKMILTNLNVFGVLLDDEKNETLIGKNGFIHAKHSKVKLLVMHTDETGEMDTILRNNFILYS